MHFNKNLVARTEPDFVVIVNTVEKAVSDFDLFQGTGDGKPVMLAKLFNTPDLIRGINSACDVVVHGNLDKGPMDEAEVGLTDIGRKQKRIVLGRAENGSSKRRKLFELALLFDPYGVGGVVCAVDIISVVNAACVILLGIRTSSQ